MKVLIIQSIRRPGVVLILDAFWVPLLGSFWKGFRRRFGSHFGSPSGGLMVQKTNEFKGFQSISAPRRGTFWDPLFQHFRQGFCPRFGVFWGAISRLNQGPGFDDNLEPFGLVLPIRARLARCVIDFFRNSNSFLLNIKYSAGPRPRARPGLGWKYMNFFQAQARLGPAQPGLGSGPAAEARN